MHHASDGFMVRLCKEADTTAGWEQLVERRGQRSYRAQAHHEPCGYHCCRKPRAHALEIAERLRAAVADAAIPLEQGGYVHFTVSTGVSSLVATDATVDAMLKRADAALYEAKRAGRNRVCGECLV